MRRAAWKPDRKRGSRGGRPQRCPARSIRGAPGCSGTTGQHRHLHRQERPTAAVGLGRPHRLKVLSAARDAVGPPLLHPPPIRFLGTAPRTESFPRPAPPSGQLSLLTADVPVKVRMSRRVHVGERTGVRGVWSPSPRRPPAAGSLPSPPTTCGGLAVRRAPRRALPLNSVGPHDSPVT